MSSTGGKNQALCFTPSVQPNRHPNHAPLDAPGAGSVSDVGGEPRMPMARAHATPTPAVRAQIGTSKHARCPWKNVRSAHQNNAGAATAAARERCPPRMASQ